MAAAFSALALLPACGARLPLLAGNCPAPPMIAAGERLAALAAEHADLTREIAALEREIGAIDCAAATAPAEPPALPAPVAPPAPERALDAGDIAALEGCWLLDSVFQTTNTGTGVTSRYTTWKMCFDARGVGREEMTSDTGVTCAGEVRASFDAAGSLSIEEPGNLQCSDGAFIYRMSSLCQPRPDGTAACEVRQPEVDRTGTVTFRRAPGEN